MKGRKVWVPKGPPRPERRKKSNDDETRVSVGPHPVPRGCELNLDPCRPDPRLFGHPSGSLVRGSRTDRKLFQGWKDPKSSIRKRDVPRRLWTDTETPLPGDTSRVKVRTTETVGEGLHQGLVPCVDGNTKDTCTEVVLEDPGRRDISRTLVVATHPQRRPSDSDPVS